MTDDRPSDFVSRETSEKLLQLQAMAEQWNPRINLVAKSTIPDFFNRHIADAFPLVEHAPQDGTWVDLGSGGGFPGLVIAALVGHRREVVLVESDQRKCAFLNAARRQLALRCEVIAKRIEETAPQNASVISARALAPLPKLLELATRHRGPDCTFLFPKGARWSEEVMEAEKDWRYDLNIVKRSEPGGSVLLIMKNVRQR